VRSSIILKVMVIVVVLLGIAVVVLFLSLGGAKKPAFVVLERDTLSLVDPDGNTIKKVDTKARVYDFHWVDSATIFYTVLRNKTLNIYKYNPLNDSI